MTPRSGVLIAMAWLGLLVVTSQTWWKPVRNYIEQRTHVNVPAVPVGNTKGVATKQATKQV